MSEYHAHDPLHGRLAAQEMADDEVSGYIC